MSGRVVVVGAGISGLAAAYRLVERGVHVTVLEAAPRVGGQIRTEREAGFVLEAGADTLLTQKPWALELCHRLGLGSEIEEQQGGAAILHRGRLVRVPDGFVMMAPTRWAPVLASPLFSLRGKLRLLAEPLIPRRAVEDESLASFVTRRFGREVLERVTEPVLAGLHTADADRMSLRLTAPSILDLEARHGSVTRGLRNAMRAHGGRPFGHGTGGGAFVALATGMGQLVDALAARLPAGAIRTGVRVESVREVASRQFAVDGEDGERFDATSVVFACPAFETGRILGTESRLAYASCAVVHLAYRRQQLRAPLTAFGFFVPRGARTRLLACSFVSEKFPARAPDGVVLLRAFLGGARYPHLLDDDDAALAAEAHVALAPVLGIAGGPAMTRVHRHPRAMPQYETGEAPALARAVAAIEGRAGLFVTGGGAGAVGIADCVRLAEATADRVAGRRPATATEIRTAGTR